MLRELIVPALAAAPAALLAAPQQHPAGTATAHLSSSAHANAVAAQANAIRLEGCDDLSSSMLDALEKGDFKAATSNFDAQMLASFDSKKLGTLWSSVTTRLGTLQSRGLAQAALYQDLFIVVTPLYFEKGGMAAQVVCDMDNKVVGFHIHPLRSGNAAPSSSVK